MSRHKTLGRLAAPRIESPAGQLQAGSRGLHFPPLPFTPSYQPDSETLFPINFAQIVPVRIHNIFPEQHRKIVTRLGSGSVELADLGVVGEHTTRNTTATGMPPSRNRVCDNTSSAVKIPHSLMLYFTCKRNVWSGVTIFQSYLNN